MPEFSRQSLREAIDAVRGARDATARTAESLRDHNVSRLALVLDSMAAEFDRDLAQLLNEDARLAYRAGALPEAGAGPAAGPAGGVAGN